MADFLPAHKLTISYEGGYGLLKGDKGGETYMGISRVYNPNFPGWAIIDKYKKQYGGKIPHNTRFSKDVQLETMVKDYYLVNYWNAKAKGGLIKNQETANLVYDMVVNHGQGARVVNEAINTAMNRNTVKVTNQITSDTLNWLNSNTEKIYPFILSQREKYVRSLDDFDKFGNGWINRIRKFPKTITIAAAGGAALLLLALFF